MEEDEIIYIRDIPATKASLPESFLRNISSFNLADISVTVGCVCQDEGRNVPVSLTIYRDLRSYKGRSVGISLSNFPEGVNAPNGERLVSRAALRSLDGDNWIQVYIHSAEMPCLCCSGNLRLVKCSYRSKVTCKKVQMGHLAGRCGKSIPSYS
jgi:hypothetical protein